MKKWISIVAVAGVLLACEKKELEVPVNNVVYDITVTTNWTAANHPTDYPSNPHFSPIVGMSHNSQAALFRVGELASTGIKNMAETGSRDPLNAEIDSYISQGNAAFRFNGSGISPGVGSATASVNVSSEHPLVSVVSMIAPSPDWFISAHDINLFQNGEFVQELEVEMGSYDSGTDDGVTFTSPNAASDPFVPVFLLTDPPLGDSTSVSPALGKVKFVRRN